MALAVISGALLSGFLSGAAQPAFAGSAACTPSAGFSSCTRITYSGAGQTYTVPANITAINVRLWGAAGGGANSSWYTLQGGGAGGGYATGRISVTPGQVLTVVVGQGGIAASAGSNVSTYGGGGAGGNSTNNTGKGGAGGGMSGIFSGSVSTGNALIIAGGGGGASPGADGATGLGAGGGGGSTGGQDNSATLSGRGGTQAAGGAAATGNSNCSPNPTAGSSLAGGAGGASTGTGSNEGGGGGGGGYYGGGGGLCQNSGTQNGGGGGGSSYISGAGVSAASTTAGTNFTYSGSACSGTAASGGSGDSLYTAGIGQGSCYGNGGNGDVVIQYAAPKLTLTKISIGGVGGFTFTGSNGWSSQTITTGTAGTGVAGAQQTLTSANTDTTLTESPATGFAVTGFSCTDTNSAANGNTGTFGTFSGATLTIPAANIKNDSTIACTVTNTKPTIKFQKISVGGTGTFGFSASTNLASTPGSITTATAGTAAPPSPSAINVTNANTAVTVTESAVAGYALTGFTCTDANSSITGNPGTFGTFSGSVATVPSGNVRPGAVISCVFTNTRSTAAFQKISLGGAGTFQFSASTNLASTPGNITTSTPGIAAPASPATINVTNVNTAVTVTETALAGYVLTGFACTDANSAVTGNSGSFGTFAGNVGTIPSTNVKAGSALSCTFTNTKTPTVKVQKTTVGGAGGPFTFTQTNLASAPAGITTLAAGTATPASPTAINVTATGTAVTLTETPAAGYALTAASCTDANSAITGNTGAIGTLAGNTLTIPAANVVAGADFTCSFTNAKLPTLSISKTSLGAVGAFSFAVTNDTASPVAITTVTYGTAATGPLQTLTATALTGGSVITETIPSGYAMTAASCSGLGAGGTATPNLAAGTMTLNAAATAAGSVISCSFTNTKLPTVTLTKISNGGVGTFTFTGSNGWASQNITTVTLGSGVAGATQTLAAAATATTITETIPSGYAVTAISCSGLGASGAATPNLGAGSVALDAAATAAGSAIACTFTNAKLPIITISKTSTGGTASFPISLTNATTSPVTLNTALSNPASSTQTLTASALTSGTAITESLGTAYIMSAASCTGLGSGGTATPNLGSATLTLNAAATSAGAVITCNITNAKAAPAITLTKTASPTSVSSAGTLINYTVAVSNSGNVAVGNINVTDPMGTITCPTSGNSAIVSLGVGATETCTVSYTVAQSDFDNNGGGDGTLDNTATASGAYAATPVSASGSAHVAIALNPKLTVLKTANKSGPLKVGDIVTYTYTVTNSGNITMHNVKVSDTHNGYGTFAGPGNEALQTSTHTPVASTDSLVNGSWDALAPGDVIAFTATYTVTQSDVDLLQ